jgi:hypothetical protein
MQRTCTRVLYQHVVVQTLQTLENLTSNAEEVLFDALIPSLRIPPRVFVLLTTKYKVTWCYLN